MHRRRFLAATAQMALGSGAGALLSGIVPRRVLAAREFAHFNEFEVRMLVVWTRALFPHPDLADDVYIEAVTYMDGQPAEVLGLIRAGLSALDAAAAGAWLDAPVDDKLAVLEAVQDRPFFAAVLNLAIDSLYRNRRVWKLLGYQGSSLEYGGYLTRGFDDIDWLPPADEPA